MSEVNLQFKKKRDEIRVLSDYKVTLPFQS